jgi:hypothetical protein
LAINYFDILATLAYTVCWSGAVATLRSGDFQYYGLQQILRFQEQGGKLSPKRLFVSFLPSNRTDFLLGRILAVIITDGDLTPANDECMRS